MPSNTVDGNLQVRGNISADSFGLPANSVGNTQVKASEPLGVDKMTHQYVPLVSQAHGAASVARREVIHVARGAGLLREMRAGVVVANIGGATITIDVYKNGATVLSGAEVIDNSVAAFDVVTGALAASPTAYADEDVFEVVVTVAAGGGTIGQGVWVQLVFEEDAD